MHRLVSDTPTALEPPPRPSWVIEEQLRELAPVLKAAGEHQADDPASQFTHRSLARHRLELLDELRAAELLASEADVELSLEGPSTSAHEAPAALLGRFLVDLQNLILAVAQVRAGRPTSRAPVRHDLVAEHRLLVLPGFQPTSFGIRLRLPTREELGALFDSGANEVLQTTCEALGDDPAGDGVVELIRHARVRTHYERLMNLLARENTGVVARTRLRPRGVRLQPEQARDRLAWLETLQTSEETVTRTGVLVGGHITRDRFDLDCGDGLISGSLTEHAREQMLQLHLGQRVVALLRTHTIEHEDGVAEPRVDYLAESIEADT